MGGFIYNPNGVSYQRVVGNTLPQPQWTEIDFDPVRGVIIDTEFQSTSTTNAYLLYQSFINQGIACKLRIQNGKGTLIIKDSTYTYTLDNWQLKPNDEIIDTLLNPLIVQYINDNVVQPPPAPTYSLTDVVAAMRQGLADNLSSTEVFDVGTPLEPFIETIVQYLYQDMQAGLTGWRNDGNGEGYVLHHSTNVSSQSQENIADFGTGQIYTTAQLISEVTDGALWNNVLSQRLVYKIMNLVPPTPKPNWIIGWFKSRSEENNEANNRTSITTDYTFGQFPDYLYTPYP